MSCLGALASLQNHLPGKLLIGDEGARAIVAGLTVHQSLKQLYLSGNSIGGDGISAAALALASLQSLEYLDLKRNAIGDDGVQALVEGISHCSNLSELAVDGN